MARLHGRFAASAVVMFALLTASLRAQESLDARISSDRIGQIEPGSYAAGDNVDFTLDRAGTKFLLRFDDSPEVFVLHSDLASLGGRVLKYDSGETALQVSGWGGVTLYTDADPAGLPAVRTGEANPLVSAPQSVSEVETAAQDDAEHLASARRLNLNLTADWDALSDDPSACSVALDALENAVRGLVQFSATATGRAALAHRIDTLLLVSENHPALALRGKTLTVGFDPAQGYAGRASSRAVVRQLATLLSVTRKQS